MSGWWRDNRLWLAALPLCLVGLAAASSYNVLDWYRGDWRHEVARADAGEWLEVREEYDDALGATTRTYEVRLVELEPVDEWPHYFDGPGAPPDGTTALQAHLEWRADPDQVISGCTLTLVDTEGNRYDTGSRDSLTVCVPEDASGPDDPETEGDVRGELPLFEEPRPPEWSSDPVFLVPEDAELTELRLRWGPPPDYVALSVP